MCGINGIYGLEELKEPKELVARMNQALAHRGPDADGVYVNGNVALGHRRLSIIDVSAGANQPFTSADGRYTIIYNGELYNFRQLRNEIDYPYQTQSDTEVVLAAYMKWGKNCLRAFNGMFAFAIWDSVDGGLFLARDRVGIKPLYYARIGSSVLFSSEVRAILSSGMIPRKIDRRALVDYLRYQTVHAPDTLVSGIKMLLPGHYMLVNDNQCKSYSYWSPAQDYSREIGDWPYEQVKTSVRQKLESAVEKRMIADVPLGAFLSGGIDSSIIVALMSQQSEKPISTFSVTFDEGEFSEAKYARLVADRFKTDHNEIKLTPEDLLQNLPKALSAMDHPSGDGPNTYMVSKATKEAGITVALSGLGGDELFAGYDIFKRATKLEGKKWVMSFPPGFRKMVGSSLKVLKPSVGSEKIRALLAQDYWDLEYTYQLSRQVLLDHQVADLLNDSRLPPNRVFEIVQQGVGHQAEGFKLPLLSRVSYAEMNTYMQNVLLRDTDQMSMAHALEVRVPFLDHELVELVYGISDNHKYPTRPKNLLLSSVEGILPEEVWNRPKMGFVFPWEHWLKNELRTMAEEALKDLAESELFDGDVINDLWQRFLGQDKRVTWARIWILVVLAKWMKINGIEE